MLWWSFVVGGVAVDQVYQMKAKNPCLNEALAAHEARVARLFWRRAPIIKRGANASGSAVDQMYQAEAWPSQKQLTGIRLMQRPRLVAAPTEPCSRCGATF